MPKKKKPYKFEPLWASHLTPATEEEIEQMAKEHSISVPHARILMADMCQKESIWINHTYQVNVHDLGNDIIHLSIKRRDKQPVTDWRDKQEIKNQLVGPECEGMEIYPAESRLVDGANQYHVWVFKNPEVRIPVGFNEGRLVKDWASKGGEQRR